jgi:uncharacterized protein YndB with AHSA1/START domain
MNETEITPVGLTRDAGWELGARRTVAAPLGAVWRYLTGPGLAVWLGDAILPSEPGQTYRTTDGTTGELRSFTPERRIRLTWKPADWTHGSTLQLTVLPAATGTTIAIHQERLEHAGEREAMLEHWHAVLDSLAGELSGQRA